MKSAGKKGTAGLRSVQPRATAASRRKRGEHLSLAQPPRAKQTAPPPDGRFHEAARSQFPPYNRRALAENGGAFTIAAIRELTFNLAGPPSARKLPAAEATSGRRPMAGRRLKAGGRRV